MIHKNLQLAFYTEYYLKTNANRVVGKAVIVNWIGTIQEGINLYAICPHNLG